MKLFQTLAIIVSLGLVMTIFSCKSSGEATQRSASAASKTNVSTMLELLKMQPGLQVFGSGANVKMQIRGNRTFNDSGEPLIILNGYRLGTGYDLISNINPGDVDRITIVTDPAEQATYGLGAANGVIDIKLKK